MTTWSPLGSPPPLPIGGGEKITKREKWTKLFAGDESHKQAFEKLLTLKHQIPKDSLKMFVLPNPHNTFENQFPPMMMMYDFEAEKIARLILGDLQTFRNAAEYNSNHAEGIQYKKNYQLKPRVYTRKRKLEESTLPPPPPPI